MGADLAHGGKRVAHDRGNRGVWHRRHAGGVIPGRATGQSVGRVAAAAGALAGGARRLVGAPWRTGLVGGALFAADSWALGTAYRSDAEYLLAVCVRPADQCVGRLGDGVRGERRMVDPS